VQGPDVGDAFGVTLVGVEGAARFARCAGSLHDCERWRSVGRIASAAIPSRRARLSWEPGS
jgi:hypothetical protein